LFICYEMPLTMASRNTGEGGGI